MLFWLRKDAQLASKRCPFEVLLTPFKTRINTLLKSPLLHLDYMIVTKAIFTHILDRF